MTRKGSARDHADAPPTTADDQPAPRRPSRSRSSSRASDTPSSDSAQTRRNSADFPTSATTPSAPEFPQHEPYSHVVSESDSSDEENINTIGNVPLEWYRHEDHIGYDQDGAAIVKVSG